MTTKSEKREWKKPTHVCFGLSDITDGTIGPGGTVATTGEGGTKFPAPTEACVDDGPSIVGSS